MRDPIKNQPKNKDDRVQAEHGNGIDLTGRDRLVSNVIFSWAAQFVFVISGFILPRMIDRRLGQDLLGVWDFAWSLVSYFYLVDAGVTSAVNRYVARYRAVGNIPGLNRIVSSASCTLSISALLVLCLTVTVCLLLPQWFGTRLGESVLEAQWVVFFLGLSLCIQIAFGAFGGIITGCHRWALQNIISAGAHAVIVAAMIVALVIDGRLRTLAVINSVGMMLAGTTRVIIAHRVCEGLRIRPSLVGWIMIRRVFAFGGKTLIPSVSNLLMNQTINVLIVAYLGTAALALYNRPRSLINHVDTLIRKMAMTLTPTTSSLQSAGKLEDIRELLIKSVRYSLYIVLPTVLMLVVFGGPILQVWMGPRYANGLIAAILAAGYLAALAQTPILMILAGLNAHGRAGIGLFISSLTSVGLVVLTVGFFKWGIAGAAVSVAVPLTILNVVYLPLLICRRVGLDMLRYFLSVTVGPAIHVLPYAICLVGARLIFQTRPLLGLLLGGAVGGIVLAILYWRYVLPDRIKMWVFRYLHRMPRLAGLLGASSTTRLVTQSSEKTKTEAFGEERPEAH